jgi:hypothetical protein
LSVDEFPSLSVFKERALEVAQVVGEKLGEMDKALGKKHGEKFSASFPELTDKSRRRYSDQYLAYVRPSDGRLDGMLARLKFVNVLKDVGVVRIGITEPGFRFAEFRNPLVDDTGENQALSQEEAAFLIRHIDSNLPSEAQHMRWMMQQIADGVTSRTNLNSKMGEFYAKYQSGGRTWTSAHVNTMRAGLLSRLVELGRIATTKKGLEVTYLLTAEGRNLLDTKFGGMT